ncbi:MAG TPA: fluoride efflux transporter CrcB [Bacteroidia bacterium]|jgi:CrcB protein|nr:fluoride efflux transporter CrcB [Bacteroidia bacterium]
MLKTITLVGIGGAIGSILRYLVSSGIQNKFLSSFPYGTLCVNISGCFLIGIVYALATRGNVSPEWRFFLATGICGGYTTFSTFSYESLTLLRDNELFYAGAYIAGSVVLGIFATFLPVIIIEKI